MRAKINLPKAKSLQWKLLIRFCFILIILLFIMETYQYITMKEYLYKNKQQLLESRLYNVEAAVLQKTESAESLKENASYFIEKIIDSNIKIAVIDRSGNIIMASSKVETIERREGFDKHQNMKKIKEEFSIPKLSQKTYSKFLLQRRNFEGYKLIEDEKGDTQVAIWIKVGDIRNPSGLIQISTSAEHEEDLLLEQLYIYIVATIAILVIGGILGGTMFKQTLKPLYNVTDIVDKVNVGKLNTRLPEETGQSEIDRLSKAFNNMLEGIETSFEKEQYIKEQMRQFISDASHELRIPLTSIQGFSEVLLRGAAKNEKQLDLALNNILTESERLTKLVNDLLLLTKLDQKIQIQRSIEDISRIVRELYPQLQILSGERKVELELEDNIFVKVNRDQIKQVILNLIQNAVQHTTEEEGIITINVSSNEELTVIKISDNGTGISKEHIKEVFNRFFRGESHRSRKYGGYGLGLSIIKSIVDAHEGRIEVESELGVGTTFSIYLNLVSGK